MIVASRGMSDEPMHCMIVASRGMSDEPNKYSYRIHFITEKLYIKVVLRIWSFFRFYIVLVFNVFVELLV